jgi:hypothetical protein
MVELSDQCALAFLSALALGDIDVDADYSLWMTIAAVRNEAARLDPSNLASAHDTVLRTVLTPSLAECMASE